MFQFIFECYHGYLDSFQGFQNFDSTLVSITDNWINSSGSSFLTITLCTNTVLHYNCNDLRQDTIEQLRIALLIQPRQPGGIGF